MIIRDYVIEKLISNTKVTSYLWDKWGRLLFACMCMWKLSSGT